MLMGQPLVDDYDFGPANQPGATGQDPEPFDWGTFWKGLTGFGTAITPIADKVIDTAAAKRRQERLLAAEKVKFMAALPTTINTPFGEANQVMYIALPLAVVGGILISRRRGWRRKR